MNTSDAIPDFFKYEHLCQVLGQGTRMKDGKSAVLSGGVRHLRWSSSGNALEASATVESYVSTGKWYMVNLSVEGDVLSWYMCPCKQT